MFFLVLNSFILCGRRVFKDCIHWLIRGVREGKIARYLHQRYLMQIKIWNDLPYNIYNSISIASFRKKLKPYLFTKTHQPYPPLLHVSSLILLYHYLVSCRQAVTWFLQTVWSSITVHISVLVRFRASILNTST